MRIVDVKTLISSGEYAVSAEWRETRKNLHKAIGEVDWPHGSGTFTIYPQSGKARREGNGVTPIKEVLMEDLRQQGWRLEEPLNWPPNKPATLRRLGKLSRPRKPSRPGPLDAVLYTGNGPVAFEWETGNISSSHRALNKMALGLHKGILACGILVVPSRELAQYLTDRIGNMEELEPYLDLWRSIPCEQGVLEIVAIEHDATSTDVPPIPKSTSGRAHE